MRQRFLMLCLGACAAASACDQGGSALAPAGQGGVDAGGGAVATLRQDGSFVVTSHGATVVSTLPGKPLLTRASDPAQPDAWHDPTQAHADLAWIAVDASTVTVAGSDDASGVQAFHLAVAQQPADTALLSLTLAADGGFYTGLGEHFDHVSARGRVSPMFLTLGGPLESGTNEAHVPVPLLVSSRGWGLFVASREAGAFDVAATDPGAVRVTFEGRSLDAWLFVAPDPLAVVARFNRLAGLPRPLPRWALSPIHWRHWANAADVLSIAQAYRAMHIPSSALWFDDGWQTGFNTFAFDTGKYGDVAAMMQQIAALGFRVLAWTTPYLEQPSGAPKDEAQQLYETAAASHYFVEGSHGEVYVSPATPIKGGAGIVDFTNPGAQGFWESLVSRATAAGIQGFKCDYGEELIPNLFEARNPVRFADGTTSRTARLYPIEEHATYHAALDAAYPGDSLIIARASAWGGATQADVIWPGDLDAGFEHEGDALRGGSSKAVGGLPAVVIDLQTLAASGFPAFGSDTAGYRGTPTQESMRRWMEHTALTPVMQVYEDGSDRLPWTISDAAGAEYKAMATLHQQLEPYQAMLMTAAATTGVPPVRALPLAYPGDTAGFARADDEYMLGPDLLVAPVVQAGASSRSVHLPPGRWIHWWSDALLDGGASGRNVTVQAPLGQPPLFARAGGLVPMLPPDVDTLVAATAPGVTTLASRASELQARAWPAGPARVTVDDGSRIEIADDAHGVTVAWSPGVLARDLTIDVDVRARTGGSPSVHTVQTLAGTPPTWSISGGHVLLALTGAGVARIH